MSTLRHLAPKRVHLRSSKMGRLTFEEPPGVLLLESEELPGGGADLGQAVLHAPDLTLVPQSILA
jgi:hypothetical protein